MGEIMQRARRPTHAGELAANDPKGADDRNYASSPQCGSNFCRYGNFLRLSGIDPGFPHQQGRAQPMTDRIAELEAALKPFAEMARQMEQVATQHGCEPSDIIRRASYQDCAEARSALGRRDQEMLAQESRQAV
ncbi:hypothetical protein [Sphingopyxis sp. JAI128]|uniref:hypothetical protein n=1 Tax=Sphingopyxis sp. JAI128 TaxID=2723066 RepID=UPI0016116CC8|nr:hypothetical protein [Sphingopyxis sp. JAI128]MBB6425528.1 hypothetical protein [Sphingopyxis sp. JAI128]